MPVGKRQFPFSLSLQRHADVGLAALVVTIVAIMIVPLAPSVLDVLLAANLTLALLTLLVSMYISDALTFAAMPTVLLVSTLYRVALNVSSTRLILLQADAGSVIRAFGEFVVQGNYLVGAVVFFILTLVQYVVIAKGSERVAEVGARFTLDAMPGKQMAIDAEQRTGALTQDQAHQRRRALERESQFYGAMDGAMKFVKGDAIVGIVITFVNILGGLAMGVGTRELGVEQSLRIYGLLTIGDGLISQIPSLLSSTAAGIVVTRVASEHDDGSLGSDIGSQMFTRPRILTLAALFLAFLGLVPGLPGAPFLALGALLGALALSLHHAAQQAQHGASAQAAAGPASGATAQEPVVIALGSLLAPWLETSSDHKPLQELGIGGMREALERDLGVTLPAVRVRKGSELPADGYAFIVHEGQLGQGRAPIDKLALELAVHEAQQAGLEAENATDPVTGRPACWLKRSAREQAIAAGFSDLFGPAAWIRRHLWAVLRRNSSELLGLEEVQRMLRQAERASPALVSHVVPDPIPLPRLREVLGRLLDEQVSVRPLRAILEALATAREIKDDVAGLTEHVRRKLSRQLCRRYAPEGVLRAHGLDPSLEETLRDSLRPRGAGPALALAPEEARELVEALRQACDQDGRGLVLTHADLRRHVRQLAAASLPDLAVLSYDELPPDLSVEARRPVAIGVGG
ncbi:MAG: flagellar biosynthesis protein FlhA [Proteobacteria bacterium]|nr:flagellar biosynthesis protein FlhA [Pseudomonadota bacterium]